MIPLKEGQDIGVCIKSLYDNFENLTFAKVVPDFDENGDMNYYDLYNDDGLFACCDGEICTVEYVSDNLVNFVNRNGETDARFTLTKREVEVSVALVQ